MNMLGDNATYKMSHSLNSPIVKHNDLLSGYVVINEITMIQTFHHVFALSFLTSESNNGWCALIIQKVVIVENLNHECRLGSLMPMSRDLIKKDTSWESAIVVNPDGGCMCIGDNVYDIFGQDSINNILSNYGIENVAYHDRVQNNRGTLARFNCDIVTDLTDLILKK
jgi:hypothetical protein